MRVNALVTIITIFFLTSCCTVVEGRSPHRPEDPLAPTLITRWKNDTKTYELKDRYLQEGPYFNLFDKRHFESHLLPTGSISYRIGTGSVSGQQLSQLIEQLTEEVKQGKTSYANFTVLKKRDLNTHDQTGLIILKFNDYPFVVKLFIETPESFIEPFSKGFEPSCFFLLGGGNRHTNGFTRIKNLENLQKQVETNRYWHNIISFPRKWHWLPKNNRLIEISSKNLGPEKLRFGRIPAVYAVVCEYINVDRIFSLKNKNDRCIAMNLSNYLNQNIDPHINNYVIEKETRKIVPLDTEHFPTMVGYNDPPECKSYIQWYSHLSWKMVNDTRGRTKQQRRAAQYKRHWPMEPFNLS